MTTLPLTLIEDHVSPPEDYANPSQDHVIPARDLVISPLDHISNSEDHVSPSRDHVISEDTKDDSKSQEQSPPINHGNQEDSITIHELSVSPDHGPSPRQLDDTTGQLDDNIGPSPQQLDDNASPSRQADEDKSTDLDQQNGMNRSHDSSSDTVDMSTAI